MIIYDIAKKLDVFTGTPPLPKSRWPPSGADPGKGKLVKLQKYHISFRNCGGTQHHTLSWRQPVLHRPLFHNDYP